jgi:hypothetical protein
MNHILDHPSDIRLEEHAAQAVPCGFSARIKYDRVKLELPASIATIATDRSKVSLMVNRFCRISRGDDTLSPGSAPTDPDVISIAILDALIMSLS